MNKARKRQLPSSQAEKEESAHDGQNAVPTRDVDGLFASSVTVDCALRKGCVPCSYKLGCFDVALDASLCKAVPNQRPEVCPRHTDKNASNDATMGYNFDTLTVGDGDMSFSLAIARLLARTKKKHPINLVASSYESRETLSKVYPNFDQVAGELEELGATICYQVDATRLTETLPSEIVKSKRRFHRVVWNFPCSAVKAGQDGQNDEMDKNKQLVRQFVESSRHYVESGGEIHMCHKTKPPFNQWRIEEVAVELCTSSKPNVDYIGRVVLDRCLLPPYQPRKALHSKSFPCHDACFYMFKVNPGTKDVTCGETRMDTLPNPMIEYDITTGVPSPTLVPLSKKLLLAIRERLLATAATKATTRNAKQNSKLKKARRK